MDEIYYGCNGECNDRNDWNRDFVKGCTKCYISTETSIHTRRCFMTGEYCSQKTNIQKERNKLYREKQKKKIAISAFVIMNFSDMSDVVYKWRIQHFIESLKKFLYIDTENNRLYCCAEKQVENEEQTSNIKHVDRIKVIRSDSDPASNYVICSRICQQMQISDLIIVDVSSQNPNVFYEFGMAVALEKLILPICFSESFYKMELSEQIKRKKHGKRREYEKHIDCYPWRKDLFEYYGIRYKQKKREGKDNSYSGVKYLPFKEAVDEKNGFSDAKYNCFPYDEKRDGKKIGRIIYEKLEKEYNQAMVKDNTLVVYTLEGYLNENQAGQCIVNFYHEITERFQKERCFCGERVGVLVQGRGIPESDKDAKKERNLLYNIGEIIHIGVNEATHQAVRARVKPDDVLEKEKDYAKKEVEPVEEETIHAQTGLGWEYRKEIWEYVKGYSSNRGMIIYPNSPVYVERVKNLLSKDILEEKKEICYPLSSFCLYHVMLKTLRYVNEIVVDITNNCLQSLFWLGAAHGAEVYAVTVKHEFSEKERKLVEGNSESRDRNIFDVAGLWTAYYYSHDTEGFYHQLALAQFGIEKHSKIIPSDVSWHIFKKWEYLKSTEDEDYFRKGSINEESDGRKKESPNGSHLNTREEILALESYYRKCFWSTMLRYNRLRIYLPRHHDEDRRDGEPRLRVAKWDMDAVSGFTHYLSKRSVIGEYLVISLSDGVSDKKAENTNFICIGQPVKPLGKSLSDRIMDWLSEKENEDPYINKIHEYSFGKNYIKEQKCGKKIYIKGFSGIPEKKGEKNDYFTYLPGAGCVNCAERGEEDNTNKEVLRVFENDELQECSLRKFRSHTEIAQLILWREDQKDNKYFRVSVVGSSGPATFGLSSLFVDEEQKLYDFPVEENQFEGKSKEGLLYELQYEVRTKIVGLIGEKLKKEICEILKRTDAEESKSGRDSYARLVWDTVEAYLSTVLYRYFLPFLSDKDLYCIQNDICLFLNSMKVSRQIPFCLDYKNYAVSHEGSQCAIVSNDGVINIIEMIPNKIKQYLESFKGLQAFYAVEIMHANSDVEKDGTTKKIYTVQSISNLVAYAKKEVRRRKISELKQAKGTSYVIKLTSRFARDTRKVYTIKSVSELLSDDEKGIFYFIDE